MRATARLLAMHRPSAVDTNIPKAELSKRAWYAKSPRRAGSVVSSPTATGGVIISSLLPCERTSRTGGGKARDMPHGREPLRAANVASLRNIPESADGAD